jgi:uncharacterized protein YkwD
MITRRTPPALRTSIGVLLIVSLTMSAAVSAPAPPVDEGPGGWRRQMLRLLNDTREHHDLDAFRVNRPLSASALRHTRDMVHRRRVFPTENVESLVEAYGATLWAEELARGRSLGAIVRAWMNHDSTRVHLLDRRLDEAAVGILFARGRYWVTVYLHN